ncbi:hypothetical protein CFE70_006200 [Pyrenophora teres f. teres 0-1]|uniref:Uncharacterized protein n=2 Tax=Pyrenophora teres f. teres TaxID=97479 RepID=E3RUQ1_PYRTT|nr:hypothetical protein PTT_12837 [Pyrenophora teres f. teres 0-1]KAE8838316.1 hypothetical protein HRS9139_02699 [Pyrenophora teres f. teres]KAE8847520.1 hypothetical protein HRS9122_04427 [Pyrenophora teres f. teres]CAE7179961.1 hypothetical protein PTTW11_06686 [Pyrenophora teres f. teres]
MASYFDLPPQKASAAASIDQLPQDERKQLGRMSSLMSPAVAQILEGLGDEHSDSSSSEGGLSDDEDEDATCIEHTKKHDPTENLRKNKQKHVAAQAPRPSSLSPCRSNSKSSNRASGKSKPSAARAEKDSPAKAKLKQPTMARFHSLRSILFQQRIEDKIKTATEEDCQKEQNAADRWRSQHEERQMHRPQTPEKDAQQKNGIGSRLKMTMRRMTTRDSGGMEKIREDGAPVEFNDRASTASSDNEQEQDQVSRHRQESDNKSIDHADVEDLVRWVSQRDSHSDGEARKGGVVEVKEDSGHESIGDADVDDLVRHVSRNREVIDDKEAKVHSGYSDASTESDSELQHVSSGEEEDADDLVRWISHREGPKAGPVRRNLEKHDLDSDVGEHYDSDVPELGRWFRRHDGTSGESAPASLVDGNIEEITEEEERGRPRSRESVERVKEKRHMTDDDVDELVRWVTRKGSNQHDKPTESETRVKTLQREEEEEKKQELGMTVDQGSLSNVDVEHLVNYARRTSRETAMSSPPAPAGVETGDLRALRNDKEQKTSPRDFQPHLSNKREQLAEKKEGQLGRSLDHGSLSHSDVQDLIAHVQKSRV